MVSDLAGAPEISAVASATGASPAPKVFSAVRGLETFSSRFTISWTDASGTQERVELTPERYAHIKGPYNRRNVYGAIVAYGPILHANPHTQPIFESVAHYALCGTRPLLSELGADPSQVASPIVLNVTPAHPPDDALSMTLRAPCE
jgi:hypothetical protein